MSCFALRACTEISETSGIEDKPPSLPLEKSREAVVARRLVPDKIEALKKEATDEKLEKFFLRTTADAIENNIFNKRLSQEIIKEVLVDEYSLSSNNAEEGDLKK